MSALPVQDDIQVIPDTLERKGWRSDDIVRARGELLMLEWSLEDAR